ncbi:SMI1/KNR4 family protein [Macrococcoides canis]|uniref:SMI1/KNR4 family protein n=1 Tax=Macrococcoides canis TaxID=1855823 RepID=UPI001AEC5862|nr:SMI1/KNR4 family protein [Macrococcus canis]QTQ08439.1 SMI1/KNR4 family protein [Macrococcus canis]
MMDTLKSNALYLEPVYSDDYIKYIEAYHEHKLPEAFKSFIKVLNGAIFNNIIVNNTNVNRKHISLYKVFSLNPDSRYENTYVPVIGNFTDLGEFFIFATDAFDNYFALDYRKDKDTPSVVFIEHEQFNTVDETTMTKGQEFYESCEKLSEFPSAIFEIAHSFESFVSKLEIVNDGFMDGVSVESMNENIETNMTDYDEIETHMKWLNNRLVETAMKVADILPPDYKAFLLYYGKDFTGQIKGEIGSNSESEPNRFVTLTEMIENFNPNMERLQPEINRLENIVKRILNNEVKSAQGDPITGITIYYEVDGGLKTNVSYVDWSQHEEITILDRYHEALKRFTEHQFDESTLQKLERVKEIENMSEKREV